MTNNAYYPRQICLHCVSSYVIGNRCRRCGKPNTDEGRAPKALPFGYKLHTPRQNCYQIGRVLGIGGFGITYIAWDQQNQRPVAIKELFPDKFTRDPIKQTIKCSPEDSAMFHHFAKRFVDEARVISLLRNEPEIIKVFDYFEANGTGYYAMELLRGMDMQHWIMQKKAPLTWAELEGPVRQILRGLNILHGYGFIHRDISPDNIFMCSDRSVKLIDFGSVRSVDSDHFTTILKQSYAPPEQLVSAPNQGYWTDIFSLSATLYVLLTCEHPIPSSDRYEKLVNRGKDPLIPIAELKPSAPEYVCRAIMKGLNLEISDRFQTVEEMKNALYPGTQQETSGRGCKLECVSGVFAGRRFFIGAGKYVSVGRGEGTNIIAFPANTPAISRRHCVFYAHRNGILYVQDQNSRFGTFVNRNRIPPLKWTSVAPGQSITIGREVFVFMM